MTLKMTDDAHYAAIADAIRAKLGSQQTWTPAQMADAIMAITTITSRGLHGKAFNYSEMPKTNMTASAEGHLV